MRALALVLPLMLAAACDVNPYDDAQRPVVTVTTSAGVMIAWQPDGAQLVRVYRGATAGSGYGADLMWSVVSTSQNGIASGVTYGVMPSGGTLDVPAQALVTGVTYTVQVTRQDPKGSGSGFTGTGNRYVGTASFIAP